MKNKGKLIFLWTIPDPMCNNQGYLGGLSTKQ